ncbi:hypothetical protein HO173_003274 [Letharia columbiana]|uniref:Uncharacterized protein n=1 Tax=Letharia columbiana TaxID=112416 RepID=A0A8H6L7N0_9LECA|nr:uncharacterized protein HO173_003274 [Letharia columbiana]KAF6238767.1 hypothetical protein HO173_003274 [Letharia columbiana]
MQMILHYGYHSRSPKPNLTSMESAVTAEPNWSSPSLTTLPREIRTQIYRHLVVSSKSVKVCYDYHSVWLYPKAGRQNRDVSTEFLCHAVEGSEIAVEVYEEFFRNNTFDCGSCENLRRFLTTTTTRFNLYNNLFPNTSIHGYLKFEKKPWIRKVHTPYDDVSFVCHRDQHLKYLLYTKSQILPYIYGYIYPPPVLNISIHTSSNANPNVTAKSAPQSIEKVNLSWHGQSLQAHRDHISVSRFDFVRMRNADSTKNEAIIVPPVAETSPTNREQHLTESGCGFVKADADVTVSVPLNP